MSSPTELGRPPWLGLLVALALALAPAGFRFEMTGELARVVHLPLVPFQRAGVQLAPYECERGHDRRGGRSPASSARDSEEE